MNKIAALETVSVESLVSQVTDEFMERLDRGEQPEIEDYAGRHPRIATVLRQVLPALQVLRVPAPAMASPSAAAAAEPQAMGCLGDYRILGEVGRGGMGVVYEAEQISLGRRVALKVLPFAAAMDAKQLQRFKNEAQAAAHLHHQNIVPVYGVGCTRGVHYYAMQFIDGQTLGALIQDLRQQAGLDGAADAAELTGAYLPASKARSSETRSAPRLSPLPEGHVSEAAVTAPNGAISTQHSTTNPAFFRTVASWGVQTAQALEHAHQLGVVHRDIKPSNLLLDVRGNPWITDFGLAHFQSQAGLTMTGDLVGTLRYMSPEQALAKRVIVDHRTDIYSLGASLYELLTLEPVFAGSDRQELLRQIAFEEPRPLRRLKKTIPAELETIVLKAVEKNPADRYATAQELADDLERFLKDESIRAKRPSPWQQVKKWARRNKAVVWTSGAALVVLLAAVAVVTSLAAWRLNKEQQATTDQLDLTKQAEEKATGRLYRSLVAQAQASRLSRRIGQRFKTLELLAEATRIARDRKLSEMEFLDMRNEAIACLALPDLRVAKEWAGWPDGSYLYDFNSSVERYVRMDRQGDGSVRRVADDAEIYRLAGLGLPGARPLLSPDGKVLALGIPGRARVWKLAGPKPVLLLDVSLFGAWSLGFSPDSRQLAIAQTDGCIHLYDLGSGRQLKQLKAGLCSHSGLAFHPWKRQLAAPCDAGIQILDLDTGEVLAVIGKEPGWVAWHPDGRTLAAGAGDIINLWDVAGQKQIARLEGHKQLGLFFSFNHAGNLLASTGWDATLRLWDTRTGQQLFSSPATIHSLRFSADDRLVGLGVEDNKLRLWEVAAACGFRTLVRDPVWGKGTYCASAASPKDSLLAVGMADGVGLWDLRRGQFLAFLPIGMYRQVLFEPSGALLTNGAGGLLRWPIRADGKVPGLLRIGPAQKLPLPGTLDQIASSKDGRVVASAQYWGGLVWNRDLSDPPLRLSPHEDVRHIAVSADGRWVATGSKHGTKVKIWEARTGMLEKELPMETASLVHFSPDGKWLATTGGGCRLWAVDSWREGPKIGGVVCAFSSDARLLAVETGHGIVRLVNPDTGREHARLENPDRDQATWLTFSPDGTQLAASCEKQGIQIWDLRTIRAQLAKMGLDWDALPYPPARAEKPVSPRAMAIDAGSLSRDRPHPDLVKYGLAIALQPINPEAYRRRGIVYYNLRCYPQAVADLSLAIALGPAGDPGTVNAYERRGYSFIMLKQWDQAAADFSKTAELNPEDARAWYRCALVRLQSGDADGYRRACKSMLERFSRTEHRDTASLLAWTCVLGPDATADLPAIMQLAKKNPPSSHPWHNLITLGAAQYRAGQFEAAIKSLGWACKAFPTRDGDGTGLIWVFLAMANHRLNHMDEARRWLAKTVHEMETLTHMGLNDRDISSPIPWRNGLQLQVLRREAEALMKASAKDQSPAAGKQPAPSKK